MNLPFYKQCNRTHADATLRIGAKSSAPIRHARMPVFLICALTLCVASGVWASTTSKPKPWVVSLRKVQIQNPVEVSEQVLTLGLALYVEHCAKCHGDTGIGDGKMAGDLEVKSTDLTLDNIWSQTDGELFYKITKGRKPMPGYRRQMSEKQRWRVIHYMRSLSSMPDIIPARFTASDAQREAISTLFLAYQKVHKALSQNDIMQATGAIANVSSAVAALAKIDAPKVQEMTDGSDKSWKEVMKKISSTSARWITEDSGGFRKIFGAFSNLLAELVRQFGHAESKPLHLYSSQTPDGNPNVWLQTDGPAVDPYKEATGKSTTTLLKKLGSQSFDES